jgi:L-asparaginase/Glu-tRNA(Gln) amidotransferase subunit D
MVRLSSHELVTSAMVGGSAEAHGHLRRLTADEAVAEVTACLDERVQPERRSAVLADAAAGYTPAATDRAEHARALAVLVAAGADIDTAEQVWRERCRRSSEPWRV